MIMLITTMKLKEKCVEGDNDDGDDDGDDLEDEEPEGRNEEKRGEV